MQKGGPERCRAFSPVGLGILGCRPRRGLLMSDRALSQATTRAAAMRHSLGGILRWPIFQKLAQTSSPIGEDAGWWSWAVRRWVRTGWSKKILRFCGATADECGVAALWFHRGGIRVGLACPGQHNRQADVTHHLCL